MVYKHSQDFSNKFSSTYANIGYKFLYFIECSAQDFSKICFLLGDIGIYTSAFLILPICTLICFNMSCTIKLNICHIQRTWNRKPPKSVLRALYIVYQLQVYLQFHY